MASLNMVMIIGRLGADPELRYAQSGNAICSLRVATDESYTDREGNRVERTEWHRVSAFNRQAENCGKYLTKGSLVLVEGKLTTREWQDQEGNKRLTTEINASRVQFLERKQDAAAPAAHAPAAAPAARANYVPQSMSRPSEQGQFVEREAPHFDDVPF